VVPQQILIRSGDQGDEAAKEGEGFEDKRRHAVRSGPGAPEAVADVAVGGEGEALEGEGSAKAVAQESLEPLAVFGGDGAGGVKREAVHARAEMFVWRLDGKRLEEGLLRERRPKRLAHGISEKSLVLVEG